MRDKRRQSKTQGRLQNWAIPVYKDRDRGATRERIFGYLNKAKLIDPKKLKMSYIFDLTFDFDLSMVDAREWVDEWMDYTSKKERELRELRAINRKERMQMARFKEAI